MLLLWVLACTAPECPPTTVSWTTPEDGAEMVTTDSDFSFGAVNVNLVYRWEYRPGSTFFLVWTHSRSDFETREDYTGGPTFNNPLSADELFRNEPENTLLAKFTYWLSL